MLTHELTATSPTQLLGVRDWRNAAAWLAFYCRYDQFVFDCCRAVVGDPEMADEVRAAVWGEVARRMRTFRYDPRRRFRGWLRKLCRSRAIDFLRKRKRDSRGVQIVQDEVLSAVADEVAIREGRSDHCDQDDGPPGEFLVAAQEVQQAARRRVSERTWNVFWQIAIADRTFAEVGHEFGMTYAAVYMAYSRAERILHEEGERHRHSRSAAGTDGNCARPE